MKFCVRPKRKEKDQQFIQHGTRLVLDLISTSEGRSNPIRIFSKDELKKATENFSSKQLLGTGLVNTSYKGTEKGQTISVKVPTFQISKWQKNYLFIEVVMLSQINHNNVIKLLGCCLEMEALVLVYEYLQNGTLYHHIHERDQHDRFSWGERLRVGTEIADAISYLHLGTSRPIIHRDLTSSNVLFDENFKAKISNFGLSVSIPAGEALVRLNDVGIIRKCCAPECMTLMVTEKADVYSFGVILVELLCGKMPWEMIVHNRVPTTFLSHFIFCVEEKRLEMVLDFSILEEGRIHQLEECAELAVRCLKKEQEERPTMKEVVQLLREMARCS